MPSAPPGAVFKTGTAATPFFATLSQNGDLDYPLFGLKLTRDTGGSLTFGAIDGSVVTNRSAIEWNEVVPFAPFLDSDSDSDDTSASYLQWTLVLDAISVRPFSRLIGFSERDGPTTFKHRSTGVR